MAHLLNKFTTGCPSSCKLVLPYRYFATGTGIIWCPQLPSILQAIKPCRYRYRNVLFRHHPQGLTLGAHALLKSRLPRPAWPGPGQWLRLGRAVARTTQPRGYAQAARRLCPLYVVGRYFPLLVVAKGRLHGRVVGRRHLTASAVSKQDRTEQTWALKQDGTTQAWALNGNSANHRRVLSSCDEAMHSRMRPIRHSSDPQHSDRRSLVDHLTPAALPDLFTDNPPYDRDTFQIISSDTHLPALLHVCQSLLQLPSVTPVFHQPNARHRRRPTHARRTVNVHL